MLVEVLDGEDREVGLAEGLVFVPLLGGAGFLLEADMLSTIYSNSPQTLTSDNIPDTGLTNVIFIDISGFDGDDDWRSPTETSFMSSALLRLLTLAK